MIDNKITWDDKKIGDMVTAEDFNEIKHQHNDTVDAINSEIQIIKDSQNQTNADLDRLSSKLTFESI